MRRLATALLACALPAQANPDHVVAPDGRSGNVTLRFDDAVRSAYGFTTGDYGLRRGEHGISNVNAQILLATTEAGDGLHVNFQAQESVRFLDLGPMTGPGGASLFDRVTVHEVRQRMARRTPVKNCRAVVPDHVYLLAIGNAVQGDRFTLPGEPLYVKLHVVAYEPGKSATMRWAILNEPFASWPRLAEAAGTTAPERAEIEGLLAQVVAEENVGDAVAGLMALGHKVLPAAVDLLSRLDPVAQAAAVWRIDWLLNSMLAGEELLGTTIDMTGGRSQLEAQNIMVRRWYAFALRTRTPEEWQAAVANSKRTPRPR